MSAAIPLADIEAARERLGDRIRRTPVTGSRTLSEARGRPVTLKLELFQRTGSFKPRGALNEMLLLDEATRAEGVVGVSGGNFAQGLAYAGATLGVETTIIMPRSAAATSVAATRGYGAAVEMVDTIAEAFERGEQMAAAGRAYLHPFAGERMMAGNGTAGLEIVEQVPDVTDLFVSIGGGGLMAGVASAVKALRPDVRIWGVETEGAHSMRLAIDAGEIVRMEVTSIATTLGSPWVVERTLAVAGELLEDVVVVSDTQAVAGIRLLAERQKLITEPAAACTIAAAQSMAGRLGDHVVLLICGGNVSIADISGWFERFGV